MWLMLVLSLSAADLPQQLGVISPRRGVVLMHHSTRPDFVYFRIEFLPENAPTNLVSIVLTNDLLRVEDMVQLPSGPGVMGVRAVYDDREESDVVLYRYDLRRGKPPKPSAEPIYILNVGERQGSLTNELRKLREGRKSAPAPLPPGFFGSTQGVVQAWIPLPGGTNHSYSQHLDWLADRAASGKRRSE